MLKKFVFYLITFSIPALFPLLCVEGYYAYKKLTFPTSFDGSLWALDDEAGWFHRPGASVRHIHKAPDGSIAFDVPVFTDDFGFRAAQAGGMPTEGAVMFLGDSNVFGFGVPYEDGFAAQAGAFLERPVAIVASPAYGAAQAIVLAEMHLVSLRPSYLVYFDGGHWERTVCRGKKRPRFILKPCFWQRLDGKAELVTPPAGLVGKAARFGLWPGGMIGAGQMGWSYFLVSRPVLRGWGYLVRAGMASGFAHDFAAPGADGQAIRAAIFENLKNMSRASGAPLVLLDPGGLYEDFARQDREVIYAGREVWRERVEKPSALLSENERMVPHDNHWAAGTNRLIGELIAGLIQRRQSGQGQAP
ncbi:MAG: hypothetical protein HY370_04335 [Proteobacteria bacterium]|nr:hypothetical protein [Pseudomonadota bacterium]